MGEKIITKKQLKRSFRKGLDIKPNEGMQENLLRISPDVDIIFTGGNRGGGKTIGILMDAMYDLHNPRFTAVYVRKEMTQIKSVNGLWDKGQQFFKPLGAEFISGKDKARFPSGAEIHYKHAQNESKDVIEKSYQGLEAAAIYIDEVTHIKEFQTFIYLRTINRNPDVENTRMICTCNPHPHSWVRRFLDARFIDCSGTETDGYIKPEMDGKIQYFYVYGKTEEDVIWGDSKEEVVELAGDRIIMKESLVKKGAKKEDMVTSVTFYLGDLAENEFLDKDYLNRVGGGGKEQQAVNLLGNWHVTTDGDEMVKRKHIDTMFDYTRVANDEGSDYLSLDVAYQGGDMAIFSIWRHKHLVDVITRTKMGGTELPPLVESICNTYGIHSDNVTFDAVGVGQSLKGETGFLPDAFPIEARGKPIGGAENIYETIKDQIMYIFANMIINGEFTVSEQLRFKLLPYGKNKDEQKTLYDILQNERRVLIDIDTDGKKRCMRKAEMRKMLGFSPDYLESMAYVVIFHIASTKIETEGLHFL